MIKNEIFIPAYNEEDKIIQAIFKVRQAIRGMSNTTITIVSDGSIDNTVLYAKQEGVKVLEFEKPSRRENLVKAMCSSKAQNVMIVDCDLIDYSTIRPVIENLRYVDVVIGSRYLTSSRLKRSLNRLFISKLMNLVTSILFKTKIRDHFVGFKAFKTKVLKQVVNKMEPRNTLRSMYWDAEFLIKTSELQFQILEYPIQWEEGKNTKLKANDSKMLIYMVKLWMKKILKS